MGNALVTKFDEVSPPCVQKKNGHLQVIGWNENRMTDQQYTLWTTNDILMATGGNLLSGDLSREFLSICIDSRKISARDFFVSIIGQSLDGHVFLDQVVSVGVQGVLIQQDKAGALPLDAWDKKGINCVAVPDTTRALGDLAAYHRQRQTASLVGVTGSCGKTSTREMIASVLSQCFETLSAEKNFNNDIGLPLTVLSLTSTHEWAVAELGMNRPGEIKCLGEICRPDIGVITNVGFAHIGGVGSIEGVMAAKGELLGTIQPTGTAVLNIDDPRVAKLAKRATTPVLFFGESERADVRARYVKTTGPKNQFELVMPSGSVQVELTVPGRFMVSNALAAASIGYLAGVSPEDIKKGLALFKPVSGRMVVVETAAGIHVIDDSYNANPSSMAAAIDALRHMKGTARSILVLGEMHELGRETTTMHQELGRGAARSGVTRLYAAGAFAKSVAEGALAEKMHAEDIITGTMEEITVDLKNWLLPGDWVLIKGSRAAGMEEIVSNITIWAGGHIKSD
jgi:UDP-N-acetylmuramoyl-tripeptide--D-alanyl-D-alanine ligase